MKKLKKRALSGALAGALALSLAVPAFAANETKITGTYKDVTIAVDVPETGLALINPYGLDVEVPQDGKTDTEAAPKVTISGQKIVTAPMALKNKSAMNLAVNATVLGTIKTGSDMRFATEAIEAGSTAKSAYVYLQAGASTLTGNTTAVTDAAIATAYAAWAPSPYSASTDIVVGTREATLESGNFAILKAAKMTGAGAFDEYKAGSIAFVRLSGDCTTSPRGGWATTDGFEVNVAYTFSPIELEKFTVTTGTLTKSGSTNAVPTLSYSAASAAEGDTVTVTVVYDHKDDVFTPVITAADSSTVTPSALTKDAGDSTEKTYTFTFTMPAGNVVVSGNTAG